MTALEEKMAAMTGKDAGLFVLSGTMGNQLALMAHRHFLTKHAYYEVVADAKSHIYVEENAGLAIHGRFQARPVFHDQKYLTAELIKPHIHTVQDYHRPPTGVICVENTFNGVIIPMSEIRHIKALADDYGLLTHLDGARITNASVATGTSLAEYGSCFDTISICLSKSLGAPIGSVLVGPAEKIEIARQCRKALGGGIRQGGILAAAGIYALDHHIERLQDDHDNAKFLEMKLKELGFEITIPVESNMVWASSERLGIEAQMIEDALLRRNIYIAAVDRFTFRFVCHLEITREKLEHLLRELADLFRRQQGNGQQ